MPEKAIKPAIAELKAVQSRVQEEQSKLAVLDTKAKETQAKIDALQVELSQIKPHTPEQLEQMILDDLQTDNHIRKPDVIKGEIKTLSEKLGEIRQVKARVVERLTELNASEMTLERKVWAAIAGKLSRELETHIGDRVKLLWGCVHRMQNYHHFPELPEVLKCLKRPIAAEAQLLAAKIREKYGF
ncbi:MAG: hypothetical protein E3K32_11855 [wastewater metagenome]|nr:hypothetical protein [Candidatus Loosdrechtia aerotolerans]